MHLTTAQEQEIGILLNDSLMGKNDLAHRMFDMGFQAGVASCGGASSPEIAAAQVAIGDATIHVVAAEAEIEAAAQSIEVAAVAVDAAAEHTHDETPPADVGGIVDPSGNEAAPAA